MLHEMHFCLTSPHLPNPSYSALVWFGVSQATPSNHLTSHLQVIAQIRAFLRMIFEGNTTRTQHACAINITRILMLCHQLVLSRLVKGRGLGVNQCKVGTTSNSAGSEKSAPRLACHLVCQHSPHQRRCSTPAVCNLAIQGRVYFPPIGVSNCSCNSTRRVLNYSAEAEEEEEEEGAKTIPLRLHLCVERLPACPPACHNNRLHCVASHRIASMRRYFLG